MYPYTSNQKIMKHLTKSATRTFLRVCNARFFSNLKVKLVPGCREGQAECVCRVCFRKSMRWLGRKWGEMSVSSILVSGISTRQMCFPFQKGVGRHQRMYTYTSSQENMKYSTKSATCTFLRVCNGFLTGLGRSERVALFFEFERETCTRT